MASTRHI